MLLKYTTKPGFNVLGSCISRPVLRFKQGDRLPRPAGVRRGAGPTLRSLVLALLPQLGGSWVVISGL